MSLSRLSSASGTGPTVNSTTWALALSEEVDNLQEARLCGAEGAWWEFPELEAALAAVAALIDAQGGEVLL